MKKKNETVEMLLKAIAELLAMRSRLLWILLRFAICMVVMLALLIGIGLGRLLA